MKTLVSVLCTSVFLLWLGACSEAVTEVTPDSPAFAKHKEGHNPGDGGDGGLPPALVDVGPGDSGLVGAITDPDGAIRIGTEYSVGMDFDGSARAVSTNCPPNVTFGIIEVLRKGSNLTEIVIWGGDGAGTELTSGKQALAQPVAAPNDDFTLHVHLDNIPIKSGRGKHAQVVCHVAVGDLVYDFL